MPMIDLIEIIKNECLPQRNCMLSVFDENGESGFLYFKDSQLIEVNCGKLWGTKALEAIFNWNLTSYTLGELPRGIKRSLWEPLDKMIEDTMGKGSAEGLMDVMKGLPSEAPSGAINAGLMASGDSPMANFVRQLPTVNGFLAAYQEEGASFKLVAGTPPVPTLTTEWLSNFYDQIDIMADNLGAGLLDEWFFEIEECRVWRLKVESKYFLVFSSVEGIADEFESQFKILAEAEA